MQNILFVKKEHYCLQQDDNFIAVRGKNLISGWRKPNRHRVQITGMKPRSMGLTPLLPRVFSHYFASIPSTGNHAMTKPHRIALTALTLALTTLPALRAQDAAPQPGNPGQSQRGQGRMGMGRGVRGTVTAVSGANVMLKTEAGETWTVVTTDNTRINIDRQPVKASDLKAGDEVMAAGILDQDKHEVHAMMLMGASAATVAKLKADMGKTYIVGKITAMNETKLTLERPDHVSQTILLDDSTSLKRGGRLPAELMSVAGGGAFMMGGPRGGNGGGNRPQRNPGEANNDPNTGGMSPAMEGESITLADLKVGDNVAGTGSLKNGTFVPTDLHVLVRPQRGPRQGAGAQNGNGTPNGEAPPQQ